MRIKRRAFENHLPARIVAGTATTTFRYVAIVAGTARTTDVIVQDDRRDNWVEVSGAGG